jgi:hypothetical protein
LAGSRAAKTQTFLHPASILMKKLAFPLPNPNFIYLYPAKRGRNRLARESAFFGLFLEG